MGSSNCVAAKKKRGKSQTSTKITRIFRLEPVKMAKFNSTADLTTSKIATLTKNASCFEGSDPGFKEVKLTDPVPAFSGTFREKKNVLDNFDVFIFAFTYLSI